MIQTQHQLLQTQVLRLISTLQHHPRSSTAVLISMERQRPPPIASAGSSQNPEHEFNKDQEAGSHDSVDDGSCSSQNDSTTVAAQR